MAAALLAYVLCIQALAYRSEVEWHACVTSLAHCVVLAQNAPPTTAALMLIRKRVQCDIVDTAVSMVIALACLAVI